MLRHHADDRSRNAIERDRLANDRWIAAEPTLPERVAHHDDTRRHAGILARQECPPKQWPHAEHREEFRRHGSKGYSLRFIRRREIAFVLRVRCERLERANVTLVVEELGSRREPGRW